jgi:hypothetical protein
MIQASQAVSIVTGLISLIIPLDGIVNVLVVALASFTDTTPLFL